MLPTTYSSRDYFVVLTLHMLFRVTVCKKETNKQSQCDVATNRYCIIKKNDTIQSATYSKSPNK